MQHAFYFSREYKQKQSASTRRQWRKGVFDSLHKMEKRMCIRDECTTTFSVKPSSQKKYCGSSCAAKVNNTRRRVSADTRRKISQALTGREFSYKNGSPFKGTIKVPRVQVICNNPRCKKSFLKERWQKTKYCSRSCTIKHVGSRPTSPKASRGKAGIRKDVHPTAYFHSRWEANMARLYTFLGIAWEYEPKQFDIGEQMYTPDFYLPESGTYIEVKNFWWRYSRVRDKKFRETYPNIQLEVILKDEYLRLEKKYAHLIPSWEYVNSNF